MGGSDDRIAQPQIESAYVKILRQLFGKSSMYLIQRTRTPRLLTQKFYQPLNTHLGLTILASTKKNALSLNCRLQLEVVNLRRN